MIQFNFQLFLVKKQPLLESLWKWKPSISCEFTTPETEVFIHQTLILAWNGCLYPAGLGAVWLWVLFLLWMNQPGSFELLKSKQLQHALWSQHYRAQELKWVNSKQFSFDVPRYASRNLQLPLNSLFNPLDVFELLQQPKYLGVVF